MALLFQQTALSGFDLESLKVRIEQEIRKHKSLYTFQGIAFIVFGALAALLPGLTAIGVELVIGALLLVSGIFQLALSQKSNMHWWALFSSLLSIVIGGLMLWRPMAGLFAIITLLMVFLFVEGIFEILLAMQFHPVRNWGWMLFSGIVALILAALLWTGFPALGVLYIGWVVAINLILYGVSLLMLVSNTR